MGAFLSDALKTLRVSPGVVMLQFLILTPFFVALFLGLGAVGVRLVAVGQVSRACRLLELHYQDLLSVELNRLLKNDRKIKRLKRLKKATNIIKTGIILKALTIKALKRLTREQKRIFLRVQHLDVQKKRKSLEVSKQIGRGLTMRSSPLALGVYRLAGTGPYFEYALKKNFIHQQKTQSWWDLDKWALKGECASSLWRPENQKSKDYRAVLFNP